MLADVPVQALKHLRAQNPIYPQFQPMQLYEKIAVRRCQSPHYGRLNFLVHFPFMSSLSTVKCIHIKCTLKSGSKIATGMP